ncbi:MAG: cyclic nucleotide-binding domain-containing protein [Myxococcales bacterium]|nr:cyclic nucleotide-binding domain-containing protein [Myxococcales bacterium]MCB9533435.1 cyclic nucleotide-binding domain-containing protein [Myxococcales bacterium]
MPTLSAPLTRSIEEALDGGRVNDALRPLVAALEAGATGHDTLRLLALAARQLDADPEAALALDAAIHSALESDDLIGAIDAIRRLETMAGDTDDAWARVETRLRSFGFGGRPRAGTRLDRAGLGALPGGSDDALLATAVERLVAREPNRHDVERPFTFVPLLGTLPADDALGLARQLQLRIARHRQRLGEITLGAPAWIVSGVVALGDRAHEPARGSLVRGGDDAGPTAVGLLRLLSAPVGAWDAAMARADVRAAVATVDRRERLLDALVASPFARALQPLSIDRLLAGARGVRAARGAHPLIRQNRPVPGLFLVIAGHVSVVDPATDGAEIARLERGDVFGELDVLHAVGASYDVVADADAELCFWPLDAARALVDGEPEARRLLVQLGAGRTGTSAAAG